MQGADSAHESLPCVRGRQGEAAAERAVVNDSPVGCQSREWPSRSEKGHGLPWRRGCWKLKNPLSNFARDEFSVTPEIAITIKIDVTEKLSRK